MKKKYINVLGTPYAFYTDVPEEKDPELNSVSGYADRSTKKIVIAKKPRSMPEADWLPMKKIVIRHEIIHAFLFESGLDESSYWDITYSTSHPEQTVEWFAIQFPKLIEAFRMADAL